eukprot:CAMPEP_0202364052 /NCGR_PEP_ID=MMETSP1126-20121109/15600_1 /ASSEMBLY_ACC=CAM_ASM_000457 /TAXON_ID=3047 /ORGANISM="Dunaliella tertiolecta, Strain CCMP1320" /LENGTH=39 /DNA_ID= /DNA_START= /DNA_END= /DNA_ORIENTATION=
MMEKPGTYTSNKRFDHLCGGANDGVKSRGNLGEWAAFSP